MRHGFTALPIKPVGEQNHRSQPAMAVEFSTEIQSVNTAIAGGWVQSALLCAH